MKLLWCDLETTGLDFTTNGIIECAFELWDDCSTLFSYTEVVRPPFETSWHPEAMSMHIRSGLYDDCFKVGRTLEEVETEILGLIDERVPSDEKLILAGQSIHFDLSFIRHYMPRLAKRLSHRLFDVRTLLIASKLVRGPVYEMPSEVAHRAMADMTESIRVFRHFEDFYGIVNIHNY